MLNYVLESLLGPLGFISCSEAVRRCIWNHLGEHAYTDWALHIKSKQTLTLCKEKKEWNTLGKGVLIHKQSSLHFESQINRIREYDKGEKRVYFVLFWVWDMKEIWATGTNRRGRWTLSSQGELMAQQGTLRQLRFTSLMLDCLGSETRGLMLQQLQFHAKMVWRWPKSTHRAMANMTLTS